MKKESYMYLGPNVPGLVVKNHTYIGIPPKAEKMMEEDPFFANLFVKTEKLLEARQRMQDPQSVVSVSYREVLKKYAK